MDGGSTYTAAAMIPIRAISLIVIFFITVFLLVFNWIALYMAYYKLEIICIQC